MVEHWRRAKGAVRRFIKEHRLRYMWTLTFEVERTTRREVTHLVRRFFERWKERWGREPLLVVIERGRRGTERLHVHLACASYRRHREVRAIWGLGHVFVGDGQKLPYRNKPMKLASYLSKYLQKEAQLEDEGLAERERGAHRYLRTQGFNVERITTRFERCSKAMAWVTRCLGWPARVIAWGDAGKDCAYGFWLEWDVGDELSPAAPPGRVRQGRGRALAHEEDTTHHVCVL